MNDSDRYRRVGEVVAAARRLADPGHSAGREARALLPAETGLSAPGVELALAEHLETRPSNEEISALVRCAGSAPRVLVVLSAHVFTGALRAIALAAAAAPEVVVRCSSRESVFARLLVSAIEDKDIGSSIAFASTIEPSEGDEVHLYGSDEVLRDICARLPSETLVRAHGTGFGMARVGEGIDCGEAARLVAQDIVPFDQRGCLSPRVALVLGGLVRARAFAEALAVDLEGWAKRVPVGTTSGAERAEWTRHRETSWMVGEVTQRGGSLVVVTPPTRTLLIAPVVRNLQVVGCQDPAEIDALIAPVAHHVVAVGDGGHPWTGCAHARQSALGRMQRPAFDGPVDRRHPVVERAIDVLARLGGQAGASLHAWV